MLAVILAGGRSSRMGRDKASLPFGAGTMLSRLASEYAPDFKVMVSLREEGQLDTGGLPVLLDHSPGQGPLAGLQTAFRDTSVEVIFLTATDLPFGERRLALELAGRMEEGDDACLIRRASGGIEPLFALYRRSCLPAVEECLREGRRSCRSMLERVRVRWVEEAELPGFDLDRILMNVNTPEDYQRALEY